MKRVLKYLFFIFLLTSFSYGDKNFKITSTSLEQNGKNVSKYMPISIKFNQNIDKISLIGNIKLINNTNKKSIKFTRKTKGGKTLLIQPNSHLLNHTKYTLLLKKQIKSDKGLTLQNLQKIDFTTEHSIGTVSLKKGKASIKRESAKLKVKPKILLQNLDIVTTKKKTKLQLFFDDNTIITLGNKTVFKIVGYEHNKKANFDIEKGYFKAITGKIGKLAPKNFSIQTKTALIGIRGTIFEGQIGTKRGGDFISCLDGEISITSRKTNKTIILKKQQGVHVSRNGHIGKVQTITSNKYKK